MSKHALEADNIVLISIVEENIEIMQCSLSLLKSSLQTAGPIHAVMAENISRLQSRIADNRDFLSNLFNEDRYPRIFD